MTISKKIIHHTPKLCAKVPIVPSLSYENMLCRTATYISWDDVASFSEMWICGRFAATARSRSSLPQAPRKTVIVGTVAESSFSNSRLQLQRLSSISFGPKMRSERGHKMIVPLSRRMVDPNYCACVIASVKFPPIVSQSFSVRKTS